jgi:hypothetical protein
MVELLMKQRRREKERGQGHDISLKNKPQVTY